MTMEYPHEPVLLHEVIQYLAVKPDGTYVDGTVGSGGHSLALAERLGPGGRLVCLDRDPDAVRLSKERLSFLGERLVVHKASYGDLQEALQQWDIPGVNGVLLDLGMSTHQLEKSGRGFSFKRDEPLDMRMDPDLGVTAGDLVNTLSADQLETILKEYGEERRARSIARRIVRARSGDSIRSSLQLAELVRTLFPSHGRAAARHPATRTFQALRIAVNSELEILRAFLEGLPPLVLVGGRVVIISYHSLEDRIVKHHMENWERPCTCPPDFPRCVCGKKPLFRRVVPRLLKPGKSEIDRNPKARSALLRAAERLPQ